MKYFQRLMAALGLMLALGLLVPAFASAHESRKVDNDKYQFVVGWLNEPAYSGFLNSIDLTVTGLSGASAATPAASSDGDNDASAGTPVTGLEDTLKADIIYNDKTMTLDLEPRYNQPGKYSGYVIPMVAGDYSFHIYGTINGDKIDETFTSGPNTFGSVIDAKTIEFPQP
jgi:hypothetical protein